MICISVGLAHKSKKQKTSHVRAVYGILLSRSKTGLPSDRRPRIEAKQIQHRERLERFLFSDRPFTVLFSFQVDDDLVLL